MLQTSSGRLLGVAAAVSVVVGAGWFVLRQRPPASTATPPPPPASPSPPPPAPEAPERRSLADSSMVVGVCVSLMGAGSRESVLEKISEVCITLLGTGACHWRVTTFNLTTGALVPVSVCNSTRDPLVRPPSQHMSASDLGPVVKAKAPSTSPFSRKAPHGDGNVLVFAVPIVDSLSKDVLGVIEAVGPASVPAATFGTVYSTLTEVARLGAKAIDAVEAQGESFNMPTQYDQLLHSLNGIAHETETVAVIEKVIDSAYTLLSAERITLFLVDTSGKELIVSSSQDVEGNRLPVSRGLAGYVATSGHFLNIANAYEDQRFDPTFDKTTGFVTRSVVAVPIRDRHGSIVGVLQAINRQDPVGKVPADDAGPYPFQDIDVSVLDVLAAHAAAALRKAQLLADIGRAERKAKALLEVVKCNSSEATLDGIVSRVVTAAYALLSADRISLYLVDTVKQELWMAVSKDAVGVRIPLGKGIAGHVASTGVSVNIAEAYEDPRFNSSVDKMTGFRTQSVLCMPVTLSGTRQPLAVLQAINKRGAPRFDDVDEELMQTFCGEVAFALTRKSVDATLAKMVSDGGTSGAQEVNVSLASLFSKGAPAMNMTTSVRLERSSVASSGSWPSGLKASEARDVSAELLDWSFDPFAVSDEELIKDVVAMLHEFELVRRFKIQDQQLQRFILSVQTGYKDNPFHNFRHAFSVMHATFLILIKTRASRYLSYLGILAALVAALCHDIDHPGHNNAFEVNSLSPLAIEHSDDAVLERHHAHRTFEILLNPQSAIFSNMSKEQFTEARQLIIAAILATDMSHHFEMCNELSARIARTAASQRIGSAGITSPTRSQTNRLRGGLGRPPTLRRHISLPERRAPEEEPVYDRTNAEDRMSLVRTLVHTADLSGQAFAAPVAQQWGDRVVAEFRAQATREQELGLPIAPFMASLETPKAVAQLQLGFVSNIVLPLWMKVGQLLPGLETALGNLFSNRLQYESQVLEASDVAGGAGGGGGGGVAAPSSSGGGSAAVTDDDCGSDPEEDVEEMKSP